MIPRLLLALAVVFSAPAIAAEKPHLSADPQVNEARELINGGQFKEALEILRPLTHNHRDKTDVLFLTGLAAMRAAEGAAAEEEKDALLDESIAALRAILIDRPELTRVRLELARAFFLQGEDGLSKSHFERVLAGNPPPAMAANIRHFLQQIRARRRWSAYFNFAIAPDSNLNSGTDEERLYYHFFGTEPVPIIDNAESIGSGVGYIFSAGGEYQYPLNERWRLRMGADISRTEYEGGQFDGSSLSGHFGPRFLFDKNGDASLLFNIGQSWAAGHPQHHDIGVRLEAGRHFGPRLRVNGNAYYTQRKYRHSGETRDGPLIGFSLAASYLFSPNIQGYVSAGRSYLRPKSKFLGSSSKQVNTGLSFALPWGFTVGGGYAIQWTKFESRSIFSYGLPREDKIRIINFNVLHRAFTIFGFSPQVGVALEKRTSNSRRVAYKKTRGELKFVHQF